MTIQRKTLAARMLGDSVGGPIRENYPDVPPGTHLRPTMPALKRKRDEALGTPKSKRWQVRWKYIADEIVWSSATVKWAGELDAYCEEQRRRGGFQFQIRRADGHGTVGGSQRFWNTDEGWRGFKPYAVQEEQA